MPLPADAPVDRDLVPLAAAPPARRPGVIVAAADGLFRTGLVANLEGCGFDVWPAGSGLDALDAYLMHTGEVDVLLLDTDLSDLPAEAFYRRLRAHFPGVPCYFLARDPAHPPTAGAGLPGAGLIPWPVSLAALADTLRAAALADAGPDD